MALHDVQTLTRALLYEGYMLYPYRPSAAKNQYRATIGTLWPATAPDVVAGFERSDFRAQCLLLAEPDGLLHCRLRFLQMASQDEESSWQPAMERETQITTRVGDACQQPVVANMICDGLTARLELSARHAAPGVWQVTALCANQSSPAGPDCLPRAMLSAHAVLTAEDGRFVSLRDPPARVRTHADACRSVGVWPVLAGDPLACNTMLCPPIILEDFPRVAAESDGDFFDSTEIDELLALRIHTLTEQEVREGAGADPRAAAVLARARKMSADHLLRLHGTCRDRRGGEGSGPFRRGDRVRLRPRGSADAMDALLAGRAATITAIERDMEGRVHLAVTIDDDPGRDLGLAGRPGHRFYYGPDEVEPLTHLEQCP
jgi:hypothetical protein